jgi:hypothetical protein
MLPSRLRAKPWPGKWMLPLKLPGAASLPAAGAAEAAPTAAPVTALSVLTRSKLRGEVGLGGRGAAAADVVGVANARCWCASAASASATLLLLLPLPLPLLPLPEQETNDCWLLPCERGKAAGLLPLLLSSRRSSCSRICCCHVMSSRKPACARSGLYIVTAWVCSCSHDLTCSHTSGSSTHT